ncbi:MAG: endonuclease Q family protein, partial [Bacteroidota bacterium]|nr:endonuclease Q family protein [Bacteroidota bacterium]
MKFTGDFHIHSHYSRATSKKLTPEYLDYWARYKGIKVIGTGDLTHPEWLKELQDKLEPAEQGLYKLKQEYRIKAPYCHEQEVRFILTGEISNIYKKYYKVRKVHNVVFMPDFDAVQRFQNRLQQMNFNITSDGRPILGLDSRDLLEICLDISDEMFFVPAHIWTPWFSAMGSKSGFDSIQECFGDLSSHIYAVETGLSTNPPMNWMLSSLDGYTLIANSDAHSPEKLGRNANVFNTELSYYHIIDAMKTGDPNKFLGTIDMYPQEGKYHYDGHRKCDVCWNPVETLRNNGICTVCGKKVVI